jgi:hypothetical protein
MGSGILVLTNDSPGGRVLVLRRRAVRQLDAARRGSMEPLLEKRLYRPDTEAVKELTAT